MKNEYFYMSNYKKNINGVYVLKDENNNVVTDSKGCNVTSYTLSWANHLKNIYERENKFKNIRIEKIEQ